MRRKKRRQWRTLRFEDVEDVEICTVPVDGNKRDDEKMLSLNFQVADVKQPLMAVERITEKVNHVMFGTQEADHYILNKATREKMMLNPRGRRSYVIEVQFVGGDKTPITVDSGPQENVCPWEWGKQFGIEKVEEIKFRNASGTLMDHWGQRKVMLTSPF